MSTPRRTETVDEPIDVDEGAVEAYLRTHPEFLDSRPELLTALRVTHPDTGNVISLIERQVQLLRAQNSLLEGKLAELREVAEQNNRLTERMQGLTLACLDATRLDQLLETLESRLVQDFHADAVVIRLFDTAPGCERYMAADGEELTVPEHLFLLNRPICGRLKPEQLDYLFRDRAADMGSAAVIPLHDDARYGVLAIGSHNPERFHPAMGTLFLGHLGQLASRALRRHLGGSG